MNNDRRRKKPAVLIRTPDHHLRVFVSSTLQELEPERKAVRQAITELRLAPVMFESGARPHPAQDLYQAYLSQSHIFIGIYWQSYGWVGPGMQVSGLEDEYDRSRGLPRLIYIKKPSPERDPALKHMLERIRDENGSSYKYFRTTDELKELVENDLMLLLTEYFETARAEEKPSDDLAPSSPTNVPIPRNPLIGRELELETACNLLQQDDIALVTLTGPAGIGKSRLGIHIALQLRDQFSDGVFMVVLESISDPDLVIPTIAKTLNITEPHEGLSLGELLKMHLCEKHMLLLLDNFEHVLPAAPRLADLLESCPHIKILVTSRALLHLRAEKELPIPPLALPPLQEKPELQPLTQYSAVQLFIQRCQSVKADFQVTNENAASIAEICHSLDGLPLAIELAAARIKLLPPQALLSRLERRFEVLRGGTKDLPERHQTMYNAIDWSYSLLNESEKRLFRRLSVFRGGWTFEAAFAVCGSEEQQQVDVLDGLQMLVDNNLLRSAEEITDNPRMKMFESIHEFAHERLLETDERDTIYKRHAHYCASLAELAEKEKFGTKKQLAWRARLEAELDNMRAAMSWALENRMYACELRIATGLWRFWWTHGYWREGIQWLEQGLTGSQDSVGAVRAKALTRMGWILYKVGESSRGIASLQEAVTLWRQIEDQAGLASALSNLGGIMLPHDFDRATAMLEEALMIRRKLSDQHGIYATLMNLGLAMLRQGNMERAIELFTESLRLARDVKDDYSMGITLINLGDALIIQGDYALADAYFREAEVIYQNLADKSGLVEVERGRGRIALMNGDHRRALELMSEACIASHKLGVDPLTIVTIEGIAFIKQKLNDPLCAVILLSASESLRQKYKLPRMHAHQKDCEAYISDIRASLEETAFETAWANGSKLTLDQSVAYATQPAA